MLKNIIRISVGRRKILRTGWGFVIDEVLSQKLIEQKLIFNNISINVGVKFLSWKMKFNLNLFHTERAPDIAECLVMDFIILWQQLNMEILF